MRLQVDLLWNLDYALDHVHETPSSELKNAFARKNFMPSRMSVKRHQVDPFSSVLDLAEFLTVIANTKLVHVTIRHCACSRLNDED